jgi:hypothetical protein
MYSHHAISCMHGPHGQHRQGIRLQEAAVPNHARPCSRASGSCCTGSIHPGWIHQPGWLRQAPTHTQCSACCARQQAQHACWLAGAHNKVASWLAAGHLSLLPDTATAHLSCARMACIHLGSPLGWVLLNSPPSSCQRWWVGGRATKAHATPLLGQCSPVPSRQHVAVHGPPGALLGTQHGS